MSGWPPLLPAPERPPYRAAAVAAGIVWLGYLFTLAPTVTLWDAGEFITAAKTLGIPHPPGTPLFVLLGNVWGRVVALGEYAWRLNLMSATFSAACAGCLFLVAHEALRDLPERLRRGGAAAAALVSAFTFTTWQNSNETEVYTVATFSAAAIAWLCLRWRAGRGLGRGPRSLLLALYLASLALGNHLMALLVGPAVVIFLVDVLRRHPAADLGMRRVEWAQTATVGAVWVVLVGIGLGSGLVLGIGGLAFAGALALALRARAPAFPLAALGVVAIGVSTYAFLYLRSGLDPVLDMADPETWGRLVDVIRRAQYPPRGLLDDPHFPPGAGNPGRSVALVLQQLVNYVQYFDWQWAAGVARSVPAGLTPRIAVTGVFLALGTIGLTTLWRRDPSAAALLFTVFLVTGLGLVAYMNFKPGFSLFWDRYVTMAEHEVRERDYFFTLSFQVWGVLAGLGLAQLAREGMERWGRGGMGVLGLALLPVFLNFTAASRRHRPDATLARDWAYDMLQSVPPYGVLFTYGDNDTYPLWYAQEVERVRQDVLMVNLSLANTAWHLRQVRDRVPRPFVATDAPALYGGAAGAAPPAGALLDLTDAEIGALGAHRIAEDAVLKLGTLELPVAAGTIVLPRDQAVLLIVAKWLGRRPLALGYQSWRGVGVRLEPWLVLQGLAALIEAGPREALPSVVPGVASVAVDVERTEYLVNDVFRYADLLAVEGAQLEPAARQVALGLAGPLIELAQAYLDRADLERAVGYLRRADRIAPTAALGAAVARLQADLERPPPQRSQP